MLENRVANVITLDRFVLQAEVAKDAVPPNHIYFIRLVSNKVAIKRIPAETAYKDSYHSKQVYREIAMLKQASNCPYFLQ